MLTYGAKPRNGFELILGGAQPRAASFEQTFIVGSPITISAPTPQTLGGVTYSFSSWSHRGA